MPVMMSDIFYFQNDTEKTYSVLSHRSSGSLDQNCRPSILRRITCGGATNFSHLLPNQLMHVLEKFILSCVDFCIRKKECAAAFVFFKTRYAAVVVSQVLQSSNPMLWVTDLAPEPHDVYWSNLWIPYWQLWFRRIAILFAAILFMFLFLVPVTFVQGLSQLEQLQQMFPFLKGILRKTFVSQLVTGYLPSVILQLFLYLVPPTMMLFSAVEGSISRSGRKRSACCKVLYFTIWNVFFVNLLSGSIISQLNAISRPKDIPMQLAKAVPRQATFFITYVLTSGWTSLSSEIMQLYALVSNWFNKFILGKKEDPSYSALSFPYHTEVPKVLLFGLLGFTCSVLAPLILPFLLVYFLLGYVVYRNQIVNVYVSKYETGGQIWPIVHNTTIFSLVLTQIIALGVFGIKHSPIASGFTIPLLICTLLFNEYCRKRFGPIFKMFSAEVLIEMDRQDEKCGRTEEIHRQLLSAYCQFSLTLNDLLCKDDDSNHSGDANCMHYPEDMKPGEESTQMSEPWTASKD
ncbi:PREDICTED: CSC1-like protein RXW8 isoform X1 [Nelumbo nucifera]|uniref:CSC1-like protein RXW8 isoform X1 n=1 Tax=Nelumbo nucifera TaxID=4432 RepID=A0A1U7Z596_NELNU|nr:PREDICTED: CSC1-like protein RXW8 isoform X1 [Nelumbo nucifera]